MVDVVVSEVEALLGLGVEDYDMESVERLESFIIDCNNAANDYEGSTLVDDTVYDRLISILREVKPESGLLSELWADEGDITDYSGHLQSHPMMSIQTVKSWDHKDYEAFLDNVQDVSEDDIALFLSYKIDGHGVRVVYDNGELVLATSRARSSAGRDLTRQMKNILGDRKEGLEGLGIVEIRGEVALPLSRLDDAREFNPKIKSAFSGVSSMIKPKSTEEENNLLEFLAYRAIGDDLNFSLKSDEYSFLEELRFEVPRYVIMELEEGDDLDSSLQETVTSLEEEYEEYDFFCDGIVVEIEDRQEFESLGTDGIRANGNIALKVNHWAQELYHGYVQKIEWRRGKSKFSPVAIVSLNEDDAEFDYEENISNLEDIGVPTAHGNTVRNVPLYEPRNILILNAYPGHPISFNYGGESGVVPCTEKGQLLTDDAVRSLISKEY